MIAALVFNDLWGLLMKASPMKKYNEMKGNEGGRFLIQAIYKSRTLYPVTTQRYDLATPASWVTFYNLEMVIALAFRLNTYEASRIRQKVLGSLCQRKEKWISMYIPTGHINQYRN